MSEKYHGKADSKEKAVEQENLQAFNNSMSNKVQPQNQHHNARKEGFSRKEQNCNN